MSQMIEDIKLEQLTEWAKPNEKLMTHYAKYPLKYIDYLELEGIRLARKRILNIIKERKTPNGLKLVALFRSAWSEGDDINED